MLTTTGRVIMVSGANRGIGWAIAQHLHEQGYELSLGVRRPEETEELVKHWQSGSVSVHLFDATRPETHDQWVDDTFEAHGRIDGLINNAGMLETGGLLDFDEASLDRMWAVNAKSPARLTSLVWPHLQRSTNGRVVNIASMTAKRVKSANLLGYAMTKHAVIALTHTTRQQGWDDGIRATSVCPSYVNTELIADFDTDSEPVTEPSDLAILVGTTLALPDSAVVAEIAINCRLEP